MKAQVIKVLSVPLCVAEPSTGPWDFHRMGQVDHGRNLIFLNPAMCPAAKATTLLHEVLHFLNRHLDLEKDMPEHVVSGLAAGVFSLIRDNPTLIESIQRLSLEAPAGQELMPPVPEPGVSAGEGVMDMACKGKKGKKGKGK